MQKKRVLLSQHWPHSIIPEMERYVKQLEDAGCEVDLYPSSDTLRVADLKRLIPGYYAHICGYDEWTAEAMDAADSLRIISRIGVGMDKVDVAYATKRNILCTNTVGTPSETVAEFVIMMMMVLSRKLMANIKAVYDGSWSMHIGPSFYRKTLGIIGFGFIGRTLAKWVQPFGMRVLAYDLKEDYQYATIHNIEYVSLETLLRESDFVTVNIPRTKESTNLIGERELAMMKPSSYLIHTARGGIVNEEALYHALKNHQIAGASVDVYVQEPVNRDNPLLTLDNVVLTPHVGGNSVQGCTKALSTAVQNVVDILHGVKPRGLLNPEIF